MSDDVPTPSDTFDAADSHASAEGVEMADGSDDASSSITSALLETEPDISVSDARQKTGLGPAGAHAYIGLRKVMHGFGAGGPDAGTPAIVNFGLSGYHGFLAFSDTDKDDDMDGESIHIDNDDDADDVFGGPNAGGAE